MGSSKGLLQWAIQTFDFPPTQIHPTTRQSSFQCHSVIWWWFLQIWWLCINGDNWELVKRWSRCSGEKMSFSKPITPDGANITSMIAFSTEHCHIPSLFVCLRVTLEVSSCKSCRSANPLHILSFTDCSCWSTIATIPMLILINNRNTGHSIRRATFADNLLPVPLMISTVRRGSIPYPTRIPSLPTTRFCNPESPQSFSIFVNEEKNQIQQTFLLFGCMLSLHLGTVECCINCFYAGTNDSGLLTRDYGLVDVTRTGLLQPTQIWHNSHLRGWWWVVQT